MSLNPVLWLGDHQVGADMPCYIIAEIGVNHNGDAELAHQMIDLAKNAGADAVKFQTYVTDELVLKEAVKATYQTVNSGDGTQSDMLRQYELPFSVFSKLKDHCDAVDIDFISTAFDVVSLDFVITLDPVCLKWASGELTNKPLLRRAGRSGLPILMSTGMGSLTEISSAIDWLGPEVDLVILQCVSDYPAAIEDQNLRVLPVMGAAFGCPVGFSDHTLGPYAAVAARALGMSVLEKHFTLDQSLPGPDHAASVEPEEFGELVRVIRQVEIGLGDGVKQPTGAEKNLIQVARKSLVFHSDLPEGHVLREEDLTAKRPGIGLSPDQLEYVVGRALSRAVRRDDLVETSHVR